MLLSCWLCQHDLKRNSPNVKTPIVQYKHQARVLVIFHINLLSKIRFNDHMISRVTKNISFKRADNSVAFYLWQKVAVIPCLKKAALLIRLPTHLICHKSYYIFETKGKSEMHILNKSLAKLSLANRKELELVFLVPLSFSAQDN